MQSSLQASLNRAALLLKTAWVGSLWTIGYLVAPLLFHYLPDRNLAGTIAGQMFQGQAWLSLICAALLIVFARLQRHAIAWQIWGMLICTGLGYFALHPFMAELRAQGLMNSDVQWKFGALHGLASGLYLIQSILGAIWILDRGDQPQSGSTGPG
jgi:hypothetical protein